VLANGKSVEGVSVERRDLGGNGWLKRIVKIDRRDRIHYEVIQKG